MDKLRKESNKHSRGQNCWTVFDGMVTKREGLTESEADALIASCRAEYARQAKEKEADLPTK
ncbi:hypothetical protein D3C77_795840 [compost metagenome]